MIKNLIYICLSITLLSCNKKLDEIPETTEALFYLKGEIDGEKIECFVDDRQYLMEKQKVNVNGVSFFQSSLKSNDATYELGFYNGNVDFLDFSYDAFKSKSSFEFCKKEEIPLLEVNKFIFYYPEQVQQIEWWVDNEFYSLNELVIYEPGKYSICAKITFTNNTEATICNELILGYHKNASAKIDFKLDENEIVANVLAENSEIVAVDWYMDDVFLTSNLNLINKIDKNKHLLKANVTFSNGVKKTRTVLVDGNEGKHAMQDYASLENECKYKRDYMFQFSIKDAATYSTFEIDNANSKFNISDFEKVGLDENGNEIYQVKGNFIGKLKSTTTNTIKNVNLTISYGFVLK